MKKISFLLFQITEISVATVHDIHYLVSKTSQRYNCLHKGIIHNFKDWKLIRSVPMIWSIKVCCILLILLCSHAGFSFFF